MDNKLENVKNHLSERREFYIGVSCGVAAVGITCLIMRGVASSQPIGHGISVTAERGISVLGKKVVMNDVSYIVSNRQGPPSWVVRCVETGGIFSSQNSAAREMGLSTAELSKHLNGLMDTVRGYTFERICMAA